MNIRRRSGETHMSGVLSFAKNRRSYLLALSIAIVFVTTYLLILPALTLDEDEAQKQGGIDVPTQEQVVSGEKTDKEAKSPTATMDKVNDSKTETKAAEAETPAEDPADEETDQIAEEQTEEPAFASGELSFEGEGYTVAAAFDEEAGLPEDTNLTATEITKDDEDYKAWHDEALKALQEEDGGDKIAELKYAHFYDISLISGEDALEPAAPVDVTISYDKALKVKDEDHFRIVHFGVDEEGELAPEILDPKKVDLTLEENKLTETAFTAESFSVYGIVYTVDFEYTDEETGDTYKYSMPGGTEIRLAALLEQLGIDVLVKDVKDVKFSDESLVKVKKNLFGYDWTLESLKAFDTEETLTLTMVDGSVIEVKVTDAQYTDNLNDLLTGVSVKINGNELHAGDTVTVSKGDKFNLHLELTENDYLQFMDDTTPMVYQLPNGVDLGENATHYITVDMGVDGKVYRNQVIYDHEANTLTLKWNTNDPNFSKLVSTDNTKVSINLSGSFTEDATHVDFGMGLEVDVEHQEPHNANIAKTGQLFAPGAEGNPYGNIPAVKYTVTVTSEGSTSVNVNDTVEGTAIELDTTNWTATSNKGTTITPSFNKKGFSLNGQSLADGEVVTITYWGKVDTSKVQNLTNATYSETGNKVTLSGEDIPEKEVTHYEHQVGDNKMSKSSTGVSEVGEDGKQTVTWKIIANSNPLESIGGSTITDRISYDSLGYMSYSGEGITVTAKRADGTVASSHTYGWNSPEMNVTDTNYDKHWVFTIPETNEALTYEITYTTEVDTTKFTGLTSVVNNVDGKPGQSSGSATVGTPDTPTPQPVTYTKKAVDISEDEIVWNISVNIEKNKQGYYNPFVLTDIIPKHTFGDIGYIDDFESVSVDGLEGSERYVTSFNYQFLKQDGTSNDNAYGKTGDYKKPTEVILTFYRDETDNNPGINATQNRTLTVHVVTKNSKAWLDLAAREGIAHQDYLEHMNNARINDWDIVSDTARPMAKTVYKMRNGNVAVQGPEGTANSYKEVETPGGNQGEIKDNTKTDYPTYKFWVVVGGVTKDNLVNGNQLIIEDEFDEHFRVLLDGEDKRTQYGYSISPTSFNAHTPDSSKGEAFTWTQSNGKATFVITNPPKNGDNYYPYYTVEYWLVPKSEEALEQIKALTMEEGGKKLFTNKASSGDVETELDFEYNYKVIDKTSISETDQDTGTTTEKYTIKINPDKMTLNNGENMTMTDTYSQNLSVDYGSIKVTAVDKSGRDRSGDISWDYRRNVGTYVIPDETYVTITYNARVIGDPGSVQTISNTAYMNGFSDTVTKDRVVDIAGDSSASIVRLRLFKFAADHMEGGLDGAKFRLLDQDMNPVKDKNGNDVTYETKTAYLDKNGLVKAGEDTLPTKYVEETEQYTTGVQTYELTEAGQAYVNEAEGKYARYQDLNETGLNNHGITLYGGFVEISMNQNIQGLTIKKERTYYLEEIEAPTRTNEDGTVTHFEKSFTKYSFLITDQADYTAPGGVYVYHNNDILTVRNWPTELPSLKISKTFTGNADLTDEQKNQVTFSVQKKNDSGDYVDYPISVWDAETESIVQKATFKYGDYKDEKGTPLFDDGVLTIEDIEAGEYRVIESNQTIGDYTRSTEYLVDGERQYVTNENNGVTVTVSEEDVTNNASHDVTITNSYFTNKYEITKVAADTAEVLGNATFKIVKVNTDGTETDVKTGIKTGSDGKFNIKWTGNEWDDNYTFDKETLYYVVETDAPEGYLTPEKPDKYYFYFSSNPSEDLQETPWTPGTKSADNPDGVPSGETATDLTTGFGSATVPNKRDTGKTYITVNKKWVNAMGKDITNTMTDAEAVNVSLYRTTDLLTAGSAIDNGDTENVKDAADMRTLTINWGNNQTNKLYFIPGDRIQLTMKSTETDKKIKPSTAESDISFDKRVIAGGDDWEAASSKTWLLTTETAGNNPTITISESEGTKYSLSVNNLDLASRVYRLTKEQAGQITNGSQVQSNIALNPDNHWTQTISNLDVTDSDGKPYLYYVVEDNANSTTSYDIASKEITVTNVAPEQLEVNKRWENGSGESINSTKTDGEITYDLYQVENPLAVGPYTGTGNITIDYTGLNPADQYNNRDYRNPAFTNLIGDGSDGKIKEGSNLQIKVTTDQDYNWDMSGEVTITGGTFDSETDDIIEGKTRTFTIRNVTGNISISGYIRVGAMSNPTLEITSIEEPTNASTDFDDLVKNKIGTVTVTNSNATLSKEDAFADSIIRVTPGTKAWSSLVYNLPSEGTDNSGKKVTYTYYVQETSASGYSSETLSPTYKVNGTELDNAVSSPGDVVVIANREEEKGSVKVTKTFAGISESLLPSGFSITATWTEEGQEQSTVLTTSGEQPDNVTREGSGLSYTWTISNLPVNTEVTFKETGYEINGYSVTTTPAKNNDHEVVTTAVAAVTPGTAGFVNTYAEQPGSLKITKSVTINGQLVANVSDKGLADGTYTFELSRVLNPDDSESKEEVLVTKKADGTDIGDLKITVTNGVANPSELTVDGIPAGYYVVKETESTNNATMLDTSVEGYDSELGGIVVTVSAGDTEEVQTAAFTNKYETTTATVKKVWDDSNDSEKKRPAQLEVTLLENGEVTTNTVTLSQSNDWEQTITGLPKYKDGQLIEYHWLEADITESGYFITNVESETTATGTVTTLTNTLSKFNLETAYTGIKTWDDEGNKYQTRPNELTVTLYADGEEKTNQPVWTLDSSTNQWVYTFNGLPVFAEDGHIIKYTAQETVPKGYTKQSESVTPTDGQIGTILYEKGQDRITTDNKIKWKLGSLIDLSFVAIKPTANGDVVVWSHRTPVPSEITAITNAIKGGALPGCSNRNIVFYSGTGDVYTPHGNIRVTYDQESLSVTLDFGSTSVWSQFIVGQFNKDNSSNYDVGTTSFTNKLETTQLDGSKTWSIGGTEPPDNPVLILTRTVTTADSETGTETTSAPEEVKVKQGESFINLQPEWSGEGNQKTFTYEGLPKKDKDGNAYTYNVAEYQFTISGVTYTVTKNADGSYTATPDAEHSDAPKIQVTQTGNAITNKEATTFEFMKVWRDAEGTETVWPTGKTITVRLNARSTSSQKAFEQDVVLTFNPTSLPSGWTATTSDEGNRTIFKTNDLAARDDSGNILTYYVVETSVEGYKDPVYGFVDSGGAINIPEGDQKYTHAENSQVIVNAPEDGVELPSTGGPGTIWMYLLGAILFVGCGVTLIARRRIGRTS